MQKRRLIAPWFLATFWSIFTVYLLSVPFSAEAHLAYDSYALINIRKGSCVFELSAAYCERISSSSICQMASQKGGTKCHRKRCDSLKTGRRRGSIRAKLTGLDQALFLYQAFFWLMSSPRKIKWMRCDWGSPSVWKSKSAVCMSYREVVNP